MPIKINKCTIGKLVKVAGDNDYPATKEPAKILAKRYGQITLHRNGSTWVESNQNLIEINSFDEVEPYREFLTDEERIKYNVPKK